MFQIKTAVYRLVKQILTFTWNFTALLWTCCILKCIKSYVYLITLFTINCSCIIDDDVDRLYHIQCWHLKASAHSFKQFTSRLLKLSFSLSMHLYNSDGRHAWFHLHGISRPDRSASEATKYKMKNSLSTVGLEPSTLRFQVWYSTYWASRAWWMLSV